jgi:cobyrinic acid a,c-diamide synthase
LDPQPVIWALMDLFQCHGVQVQSFRSQSRFPTHRGATAITGLALRYLDSWIMSPEMCREAFVRGAELADLALVEGEFDWPSRERALGGRLEPLCRWLDLPRVVVLNAAEIDRCRLPPRPPSADALLLDGVQGPEHVARLTTELESLWGVPVLGALEAVPRLRRAIESIPRGSLLPRELCRRLGEHFARYAKPDRLLELASRRDMAARSRRPADTSLARIGLTVAIAYDDAFYRYFPETLDLLELGGASVVDFSPLRDESLPPQVDLVYFGCGHPERYAAALSENHCMAAALRSHVCAGRRIYSEGGGTAYLCRQMETADGCFFPMVGILPAIARLTAKPGPVEPVELSLSEANWFGSQGDRLRGYLNPHWHLDPLGDLRSFVAEEDYRHALVGTFQSVGSLLHFNFGAHPAFLDHFFVPEKPEVLIRRPTLVWPG